MSAGVCFFRFDTYGGAIHLENHLVSLFVGRDDVLDWLKLCQRGFTFLIFSLV